VHGQLGALDLGEALLDKLGRGRGRFHAYSAGSARAVR